VQTSAAPTVSALVAIAFSRLVRRLVTRCAPDSQVFGLSGVGDTFGTCFGPLSRNRQVGYRLGKGEKLEDILDSMSQVAEGVATAQALTLLVNAKVKGYRKDLKYPILFGVANILNGDISPREGLVLLMEKYPLRLEVSWLPSTTKLPPSIRFFLTPCASGSPCTGASFLSAAAWRSRGLVPQVLLCQRELWALS
jgi:hypothetical protein